MSEVVAARRRRGAARGARRGVGASVRHARRDRVHAGAAGREPRGGGQAGPQLVPGPAARGVRQDAQHALPRLLRAPGERVRGVQLGHRVPGPLLVPGVVRGLPDPQRAQPGQPAGDHQLRGLQAPVRPGRRRHLRRRADALVGLRGHRRACRRPRAGPAAARSCRPARRGCTCSTCATRRRPRWRSTSRSRAARTPRPACRTRATAPDRLQHAVVRQLQRHRRHLDPAQRCRARPSTCASSPRARTIACHDTGVILGDVLRAACSGGQGFAVWSLDRARRRLADRPAAALRQEHEDGARAEHQHRPLGGVLQRRRDAHLRPRAERRHERALPADGHAVPINTPTRCRRTT